MNQLETIGDFVKNARFFYIKVENNKEGDFGRIINGSDILTLDLTKNEIHRSIDYMNSNTYEVLKTYRDLVKTMTVESSPNSGKRYKQI